MEGHKKIRLEFTEEMHGYFSTSNFGIEKSQKSFNSAFEYGKNKNQEIKFHLTIKISDIDEFINDKNLKAEAVGTVLIPLLGGELKVDRGDFNLFVRDLVDINVDVDKEMHYLLQFKSSTDEEYTFFGYKTLVHEDLLEGWDETTTLYTTIYKGRISSIDEIKKSDDKIFGKGVLTLNMQDFVKQMGTLKCEGGGKLENLGAMGKFFNLFASKAWESFAPFYFNEETYRWNEHVIPLQSYNGVRGVKPEFIGFNTDDGLYLQFTRFKKRSSKKIAFLLHGLTTSTDMFIMPEHYNLVQYLLDNGFEDVWSLDWRGSNRYSYNLNPSKFTMDYIAKYDIPRAMNKIIEECGANVEIHAIAHCVGSMSLMMSLAFNNFPNLKSIVANSVSYHPKVRTMAKIKMSVGPELLEYVFGYPYVSPRVSYNPGFRFARWLAKMERMIRKECREPSCHMVSFMWGWGFPAAYVHSNIHPITHRRLQDLFGGVTFSYFRHVRKMLRERSAVPYEKEGEFFHLPDNYFEAFLEKNGDVPPILFLSGSENNIFPNSNKTTYEEIITRKPASNVYFLEIKNYGHQDVFMGKNAAMDVFPKLLKFINSI